MGIALRRPAVASYMRRLQYLRRCQKLSIENAVHCMLFLHGHCAGVGGGLDGVEEGEEDAAEGGFATGGVVPLLQRVDAAALASGANGDGGDAARERNVGVGGTEARFGAEGEVTIDGAESVEEWGVVGKGRRPGDFRWFQCGVLVVGRGFLCGRRGDDVVEDQADRWWLWR